MIASRCLTPTGNERLIIEHALRLERKTPYYTHKVVNMISATETLIFRYKHRVGVQLSVVWRG